MWTLSQNATASEIPHQALVVSVLNQLLRRSSIFLTGYVRTSTTPHITMMTYRMENEIIESTM